MLDLLEEVHIAREALFRIRDEIFDPRSAPSEALHHLAMALNALRKLNNAIVDQDFADRKAQQKDGEG